MRNFQRSFEYRGYRINKTSFNWRIVELNEIVESIQEAKDKIDEALNNPVQKEKKKSSPNSLEDELSKTS